MYLILFVCLVAGFVYCSGGFTGLTDQLLWRFDIDLKYEAFKYAKRFESLSLRNKVYKQHRVRRWFNTFEIVNLFDVPVESHSLNQMPHPFYFPVVEDDGFLWSSVWYYDTVLKKAVYSRFKIPNDFCMTPEEL